jgi:hypothetical protein
VLYPLLVVSLALLLLAAGLRYYATRRVSRRLAVLIARFREIAVTPGRRHPAAPDHAMLLQEHGAYTTFAEDVESLGGTILGDWEEFNPDGTSAGVTRWFVDASRHICGWFGVVAHSTGQAPATYCVSQLEPLAYVTTLRSRSDRRLASPPIHHWEHCGLEVPLALLLERHRGRLGQGDGHRSLPVAGVRDAHALVDRLRTDVAAWRQTQDPAVLLEQDLRSVLGDHYSRFGPRVARLLWDHH